MKNEIEQLPVGKSRKYQIPADEMRSITRNCRGRFRVIKESNQSCIVIRIDELEISLRQQIFNAIESLGVFDSKRIDGDIQYIRSIVSRYNNKHGRAIKVNKIHGVATLSENVMARKHITPDEFDQIRIDFENKLEMLRERIVKPEETKTGSMIN